MKRYINTAPLILCETTSIHKAVEQMLKGHQSYIVTSDSQNQITGIVSTYDILHHFQAKPSADVLSHIKSFPIQSLNFDSLEQDLNEAASIYDRSCYPVFRNKNDLKIGNLVGIFEIKEFAKHLFTNMSARKVQNLIKSFGV